MRRRVSRGCAKIFGQAPPALRCIKEEAMKKYAEIVKQVLLCCLGSAIYAAAVSLFLDPNGIVPGGFTASSRLRRVQSR